jgi:hypothetical protein
MTILMHFALQGASEQDKDFVEYHDLMSNFNQLVQYHNMTLSEGYSSIGEAFDQAATRVNNDNEGPNRAGTCARVVIKIEQVMKTLFMIPF